MPWILLVKNMLGHPVRLFLTVGSLVVAVFLICFLRTAVVAFHAGVQGAASNRMMVQSNVSLFVDLPMSYQAKIAAVKGIEQVCKFQWFGGVYKDDSSNFFAQFAIDHDIFLDAYPEIEMLEGGPDPFAAQRTACIIGRQLADRFGIAVGDTMPLTGTIFSKPQNKPWDFLVAGIYRSKSSNVDENTMFFRWDYLYETLQSDEAFGPIGVGVYVLRIAPSASPEQVGRDVDAEFANSELRTQTSSEKEFQRQFLTMFGSVPFFLSSIGGGVLFAILLAVFNTMLMAARERTPDLGIMKALGFGDGVAFALLILESLLICVIGGGLGVGLAKATEPMVIGSPLGNMLPTYAITGETIAFGFGLAVALGVVAGIVPAWQAGRVRPVEALRAD